MKKIVLILLMVMVALPSSVAQQKIMGDRNVTIKQTYVDDFHTLVVNGDFSIEIVYNSKPSVNIETDDNLHDVIEFSVVDGVLTIVETIRITSRKKLSITINYSDALQHMEVRGDQGLLGDLAGNSFEGRCFGLIQCATFMFVSQFSDSARGSTRL